MQLALIFVVVALAVAGSSGAEIGSDALLKLLKKDLCICTQEHSPHCGIARDGAPTNYANRCVAECVGATHIKAGLCDEPRPVHPIWDPNADVSSEYEYSEEEACACPRILAPVCVHKPDGYKIQYDNNCEAECRGETKWTEGECATAAQLPAHSGDHVAHLPAHSGDHVAHLPAHSGDHVAHLPAHSGNYPAQLPANKKDKRASDCGCSRRYLPVCAYKGKMAKDYDNECVARCVDASYHVVGGTCEEQESCPCTLEYDPVCATLGGKLYGNACFALCNNVFEYGACPEDYQAAARKREMKKKNKKNVCPCPAIQNEVCASNGKTYSNSCNAECDGHSWTHGACNRPAQLPAADRR